MAMGSGACRRLVGAVAEDIFGFRLISLEFVLLVVCVLYRHVLDLCVGAWGSKPSTCGCRCPATGMLPSGTSPIAHGIRAVLGQSERVRLKGSDWTTGRSISLRQCKAEVNIPCMLH